MADASAWPPERVRDLKNVRRWTWAKLAHEVGVDWTTAYRWGAGTATPSPLARQKLDEIVATGTETCPPPARNRVPVRGTE
jgi:hypothetical protein